MKRRHMPGILTFCALLCIAGPGGTAGAAPLYFNDFESRINPIGSGWSITSSNAGAALSTETVPNTEIAPSWGTFLGEFYGNDRVTLSLGNLPKGYLQIAFDTYFLRSWDGEDSRYGKDYFTAGIVGGSTFLYDTFSNGNPAGQSYAGNGTPSSAYPEWPDKPQLPAPPMTGSSLQYSLGYVFRPDYNVGLVERDESLPMTGTLSEGSQRMDSVYSFAFTFYNTSESIQLYFAGLNLQAPSNAESPYSSFIPLDAPYIDESWGLDNVKLSAIPVPEPSGLSLMVLGALSGLACFRRRKRRRNQCI